MRPGSEVDFLWGPGIALLVVGFLALMLRWTFSHGSSLVERRPRKVMRTSTARWSRWLRPAA